MNEDTAIEAILYGAGESIIDDETLLFDEADLEVLG